MFAGLDALRVRPELRLLVWAAFWANLHYRYAGDALVVFGPFLVFGCCMVAYGRRSPLDALLMGATMHCAYNAVLDPVKALLRWLLE